MGSLAIAVNLIARGDMERKPSKDIHLDHYTSFTMRIVAISLTDVDLI